MNMGDHMEAEKRFVKRLTELRQQKGVSARDMSLSIGQSESYINKIENHRALPSMTGFFYICEYFGITPEDFFEYHTEAPMLSSELIEEIRKLNYTETGHILEIVKDINRKKK